MPRHLLRYALGPLLGLFCLVATPAAGEPLPEMKRAFQLWLIQQRDCSGPGNVDLKEKARALAGLTRPLGELGDPDAPYAGEPGLTFKGDYGLFKYSTDMAVWASDQFWLLPFEKGPGQLLVVRRQDCSLNCLWKLEFYRFSQGHLEKPKSAKANFIDFPSLEDLGPKNRKCVAEVGSVLRQRDNGAMVLVVYRENFPHDNHEDSICDRQPRYEQEYRWQGRKFIKNGSIKPAARP